MKDDTVLYADRKYRLTAAETIAMLEGAGIEVQRPCEAFSIRVDSTMDARTAPGSYVTTVSIRNAPEAAARAEAAKILTGAGFDPKDVARVTGTDDSQPKAE